MLHRQDDLKTGDLIGEDKYGNKYFENKMFFYGRYIGLFARQWINYGVELFFAGRNRWVEYNEKLALDYDGSQVPAEWFGWLHYKTDLPPNKAC